MNDIEKVLNGIGISMRTSNMEFRDFSDVLDDIAEKYTSLSSVEKAALSGALGGVRQRENVNALLENYDTYKEAIETASNSQGVAEEKYEAYLDSIEAHLNQLKDAWDELAQNFEGSAFFKGVVDVATFLVEQLPKIIKLFSTLFMTMNAYKLPTWLSDLWGAVNPLKSVSAGRFKGARSRFTTGGMEDRANIRKYERLKAEGKDTSEIEAKLPKEYRDTFVTGDGNLNDTAKPIVDEQRKTNSTLDSIKTLVSTITKTENMSVSGGHGVDFVEIGSSQGVSDEASVTLLGEANPGIDPSALEKARKEAADLRKQEKRAKAKVGGLTTGLRNSQAKLKDINTQRLNLFHEGKDIDDAAGAAYNKATSQKERDNIMRAHDNQKGKNLEQQNALLEQERALLEKIQQQQAKITEAEEKRCAVTKERIAKEKEVDALWQEQERKAQNITTEVVSESQAEMTITAEKKTQLQQEQLATQEDIKQRIEEEKSLAAEKGQLAAEQGQTTQDQIQAATEASSTGFNQLPTVPGQSLLPGTATSGITPGVPKKAGIGSKIASKLNALSGGAGFSALSGIMGGLTAGVTAAATQEGDATDKAIAAASNAVTTGLISAIPGVGPILGGVLGPLLGDWISGTLLDYIHREDIAREKRVEEANKYLESLTSIKDSVANIETLNNNRENWGASDWSELSDYVRETMSVLRENDDLRLKFEENAAKIDSKYAGMSASELMQIIQTGSQNEADQLILALKGAQSSETLSATFASQEEERHTIQENIDNAQALGRYATSIFGFELAEGQSADEQLETLKKARAEMEAKALEAAESGEKGLESSYKKIIETLDKNIDTLDSSLSDLANMNDELNDIAVEETVTSTIGTWDNIRIANASLEEAIHVVAENLSLYGAAVYDAAGRITDEARTYIESTMRENDKFSSLFKDDDTALRRLLQQEDQRTSLLANTGFSYDDLREAFDYNDEEAQQEILDAINNRTETKADNIDMETLTNLVYKLDPQNLENFAEVLGMTVDEVAELKNTLGNASLADLLGDPQDTLDEIGEKISILSDYMSNGAITAENYFKILSKYSELLYKYDENGNVVGIGTENITKNLMNDIYGSEGNLGTLLGYQTYEEAKTNTNLYSAFKEIVKNKYTGNTDTGFLESATNFNDDILARLNQDQELWALYSETMEGVMIDTSEYQSLIQSIADYQSTMIDQEIEGLESVKSALEANNDARKKELDLIKAKDALENAKNGKKMVYRAGVGWTYESDQTAVQEAKQNLEDLESDKEVEDLQYQIDQLEQAKSFLEAIPSSEELNAQQETYQAWMDKITENGEKQADILSELEKAYTEISNIGEQMGLWVSKDEEVKSDADKASEALINNTGEGTESAISAAVGNVTAAEGTQDYQSQMKKVQDQIALWEQNLQKSGIGNFMDYDTLEEAQANGFTGATTQQGFESLKNQYSSMKSGKYDEYKNANTDVRFIELPNGEKFTVDPTATNSYWATNATQLITAKRDDYSAFNNASKDGTDRLYIWNDELKDWGEAADDGGTNVHGADEGWDIDPREIDNLPDGTMLKSVSSNATNYAYKYADNLYLKAYKQNRKGATDFEGGNTLINEEGTEGIITPQGTLTALPAHSGIVPADLTSNLFRLGEVAPNLVKQLSSFNYEYPTSNGVGNTDDHSTNINSLYATFQVDENFDFDQFLSEVRGTINTSRHNG